MMRKNIFPLMTIIFLLSGLNQFSWPQEISKLIGDWQMVIEAEGQYFYLLISFKETEGRLEGTISEVNGFFSNVPLTNLKLEGEKLSFDFNAPTPPDGLSRLITAELKLAPDYEKMEGTLYVPDLDILASATVTRKK